MVSTTEQRLQNAGLKTNLVVENIGYVEAKKMLLLIIG